MKIKNSFISTATILSLTGCLATTNLLDKDNSALNSEQRSVAYEIAEKTKNNCIHYKYEQTSERKISGDIKFSQPIEIKRMYTSDSGWYKAHVMSQGIWDNVYYNPSKFKFVCGEKLWNQYSESGKLEFSEIGAEIKSLDKAPSSAIKSQPIKNSSGIEERLKVLKDLFQKDLISQKQYNEQVSKILSGQ